MLLHFLQLTKALIQIMMVSLYFLALTCNEVREQDNLCPQIQPKYNTSCQPTTIVTRFACI